MLAGQGGVEAALHQLLAGAGDRVGAGIQRLGDLAVAPRFASLRGVGLQQDAGFQQLTRGGFALLDQSIEPLAFISSKFDDVSFDGGCFAVTTHLRGCRRHRFRG